MTKVSGNSAPPIIVGIGASAGGLEAIQAFLKATPANTAMAFIIVQHLSPTHPSQLVEIVSNYTTMHVHEIVHNTPVAPNTVYIIPPRHDLILRNNRLYLHEIEDSQTHPARIDTFFESLAEDQWERSVGIILSGSGTDGAIGLGKIKEYGGMTLAQSPETANYAGMPQHAIDRGVIDLSAPAPELPALLIDYVQNAHAIPTTKAQKDDKTNEVLSHILKLILYHTGHDFSSYKTNTLARRVARRMAMNSISDQRKYVQLLQHQPSEIDTLFHELLIGVTQFFRDPFAFKALRQNVLPKLLEGVATDQPIRVWVAGCSTGEEVYSIAMLLHDFLGADAVDDRLQIFATDINPQAIKFARRGRYAATIAEHISPDHLQRYFVPTEGTYQVTGNLRKLIIFAEHDILRDPPFSKLNLVSFRNVLIYLQPEAQQKVFSTLRYALHPDGFLILGTSEALGNARGAWQVIDQRAKIFRAYQSQSAARVTFDASPNKFFHLPVEKETIAMPDKQIDLRKHIEKLLLERFTSPCVVANQDGEILFFHNRTGKYLEPAIGEAKLNVLQMARPGLQMVLTSAFYEAVKVNQDVVYENVEVITNGDNQLIHLTIHPINEPPALQGLILILFENARHSELPKLDSPKTTSSDAREQRILKLERELQATQTFLQTTREELETANEELKSTNEELQSANEELQSTNEELETSKEEVNSVNEELISANAELQSKIEWLSRSNNDLQNLLNSVEIGIIFLDIQLNIQRFNPAIKQLFNLIPSDIGRSISDITFNFKHANLKRDIEVVLRDLSLYSTEIFTSEQHWYLMQIRPYRTIDNIIDGVVMTFNDITKQKQAQSDLQTLVMDVEAARDYADAVINTIRHPFLVLQQDLAVVSANSAFYKLFQVDQQSTVGVQIFELGNGQWNIPKLKKLLNDIYEEATDFEGFVMEHEFPNIGFRKLILNGRKIIDENSKQLLILLAIEEAN